MKFWLMEQLEALGIILFVSGCVFGTALLLHTYLGVPGPVALIGGIVGYVLLYALIETGAIVWVLISCVFFSFLCIWK